MSEASDSYPETPVPGAFDLPSSVLHRPAPPNTYLAPGEVVVPSIRRTPPSNTDLRGSRGVPLPDATGATSNTSQDNARSEVPAAYSESDIQRQGSSPARPVQAPWRPIFGTIPFPIQADDSSSSSSQGQGEFHHLLYILRALIALS